MNDKPLTFIGLRNANARSFGESGYRARDVPRNHWLCSLTIELGHLAQAVVVAISMRAEEQASKSAVLQRPIGDVMICLDLVAEKHGCAPDVLVNRLSPGGRAATCFRGLRAITEFDWKSPRYTPNPDVSLDVLLADLLAAFAEFVTFTHITPEGHCMTWPVYETRLDLHIATMIGRLDRLAYRVGIDLGVAVRVSFNARGRAVGSDITIQSSELTGDNQP